MGLPIPGRPRQSPPRLDPSSKMASRVQIPLCHPETPSPKVHHPSAPCLEFQGPFAQCSVQPGMGAGLGPGPALRKRPGLPTGSLVPA